MDHRCVNVWGGGGGVNTLRSAWPLDIHLIFWRLPLVPFVLHLLKYAYHLLAKTGEEDWKDLLLHFPFVLPLRNLGLAYRLYKLNFGMSDFDTKDWAEVEAIQKMVAKDGLTESFFESGPQASGCLIYEILINIFDAIKFGEAGNFGRNWWNFTGILKGQNSDVCLLFWFLWSDFSFLNSDFWILIDLSQELELMDLIDLVTLLKLSLAHWLTDVPE